MSKIAVLPQVWSTDGIIKQTIEVIKAIYDLSIPHGLGLLHYSAESMTEEEARLYIYEPDMPNLYIDYINGRACKFALRNNKCGWYDHSPDALGALIKRMSATVIDVENVTLIP